MGNFIKVTALKNGVPEKEKTWINSDKIFSINRVLGATIVVIGVLPGEQQACISVEETPEEIIKKINWSEAKKQSIVEDLHGNLKPKSEAEPQAKFMRESVFGDYDPEKGYFPFNPAKNNVPQDYDGDHVYFTPNKSKNDELGDIE